MEVSSSFLCLFVFVWCFCLFGVFLGLFFFFGGGVGFFCVVFVVFGLLFFCGEVYFFLLFFVCFSFFVLTKNDRS